MNSPEPSAIQEKRKDPRVLALFNELRANLNPTSTLIETLFDVAMFAVENNDLLDKLTTAINYIDELELKLAALSGDKPNDILKAVRNEHDLQSRVKEMEDRIKSEYPILTIGEAINGWAMMNVHLRDAITQLTNAMDSNEELATKLATAHRGILATHDVPYVITNNDPSFQFGTTNPHIKFLAQELAKIPGLTLDMAIDRWATFSLGLEELRLELKLYKEDSQRKNFAANVNAEAALDLHSQKVVRYKTESKRGKQAARAKQEKTDTIKNAVFKWCDEHRREYSHLFAKNIAEWYLVKEPVMESRAAETLATFVKEWEKKNDFQRQN